MQVRSGRSWRAWATLAVGLALLASACADDAAEVPAGARGAAQVDDTTTSRKTGGRLHDGDVRSGSTIPAPTSTTAPATTSPPAAAPSTTAPPPTTVPAPPPTTAPSAPTPRSGTRDTGCEQYMASQIDAARADVGRGALTFDAGIQSIAVDWSDEMARTQTLRHNPGYGDQIVRHRNYRTAGENVGRGYDRGTLFQAFMDSPGHRANIESDAYSHVTVGCLTDGQGQLWVTQNFWGG